MNKFSKYRQSFLRFLEIHGFYPLGAGHIFTICVFILLCIVFFMFIKVSYIEIENTKFIIEFPDKSYMCKSYQIDNNTLTLVKANNNQKIIIYNPTNYIIKKRGR